MRKLARAIKSHEKILPGLLDGIDVQDLTLRTEKGLAALGTINDIFKTSVLMRLGYTVRNITEAQLSMLAKGFAMPAMVAAGGKDAVGRFFNNRQVGFTRLIDQVNINAGRIDDVPTMQYAFMSEVDKLRAVDMSRKQLAKAISTRVGELERDAFKQRFTPGVGPLTVEDEVRTLKGVLADLESVTLYHGSADGAFKLDEARSIAMSASPAVARRYAQGGTIHSVENYLNTPSGRPGKLGNNEARIAKAQETLTNAEKRLASAQKDLATSGETQLDVNLLQKTIDEQKAIIKKAGASERAGIRRADTLNEATLNLQADMIAAKNSGAKVEVKRGAKWVEVQSIDYETLVLALETDEFETVLFKNWSNRPVFRVN
jgi:cob(I)alamin adenosyltransferase